MNSKRNLPLFLSAHKICIVCEGNEEFKYLKRLIELKVWGSPYQITFTILSHNYITFLYKLNDLTLGSALNTAAILISSFFTGRELP